MYGMVNRALKEMVVRRHGDEVWRRVVRAAGVETDVFVSLQGYPDGITYDLVGAASAVLETPAERLLRDFGHFWITYAVDSGYGDLIALTGSGVLDFLAELDTLHARVALGLPELDPPSFACTDVGPDRLTLHYRSPRPGLTPFVVGLVEGLGRHYGTPTTIEPVMTRADGADHDVFRVVVRPAVRLEVGPAERR